MDIVKNVPGASNRKRSRPYYLREYLPVTRKKPDRFRLADDAWTWEVPAVEPNIYQALIVSKEPEIILKGAPLKDVYNSVLQTSTILSHAEWMHCGVMETLDRLLDQLKNADTAADAEQFKASILEWGKMATDAKDILLQGASDVNDAGRLSVQTSGMLQLVYRDAFLQKVPFSVPVAVKDTLRRAALGGPTLFSEESVLAAIEAKTKADKSEFQKKVLQTKSDKPSSSARSSSHDHRSSGRGDRDRADVYKSQDKSSGGSYFRGDGGRKGNASQDKPYYDKSSKKDWKDKRQQGGGGRGRGRGRGGDRDRDERPARY
jgi:hypothetical protein